MLTKLAKQDKKWRRLALVICRDKNLADDITNDMYIKIYEYTQRHPNKEIKDYFVYQTLKSIFLDIKRKEKRVQLVNFDWIIHKYFEDNDILEARKYLNDKLDKLPYVDREVLLLTSEMSLRDCEKLFNNTPFGKADYQWFHYRRKKAIKKLKEILKT